MLSGTTWRDRMWADVDVAVPLASSGLHGTSMAGFRQRVPASWDIAMVVHPSVTLFVDLSEESEIDFDIGGRVRRGSVVVGLLPGDVSASSAGRVECLQIRLSPVVAAAVFGEPGGPTGSAVTLEEVWGRDAARFEDRLRAATSWDERFGTAATFLRRRLGARRSVAPELAHAWWRTQAGRGRVRVEDLADEVGWSRKRLWSRFRSQLGITPKRAAQLVRFDHAAHLLAAGRPVADVAVESGYVDQSHLHREVKAITGETPVAVASAPWLAIDDVAWPAGPP